MANEKFSALPAMTALADADVFVGLQGGVVGLGSAAQIATYVGSVAGLAIPAGRIPFGTGTGLSSAAALNWDTVNGRARMPLAYVGDPTALSAYASTGYLHATLVAANPSVAGKVYGAFIYSEGGVEASKEVEGAFIAAHSLPTSADDYSIIGADIEAFCESNSPHTLTALQTFCEWDGTGVAIEIVGMHIFTNTSTNGGTTTNNYGLWVGDQTIGVNNYAIKTGLGLVNFNDTVRLGTQSTKTAALGLCHASSTFIGTIVPSNFGAARTFTLPDKSGTFAMTSDIPGAQTITLTGDVTGSGTGSFAATLATVNGNVGTFGDSTHTLTVTVDAKGRITAIAAVAAPSPVVGLDYLLGDGSTVLTTGNKFGFRVPFACTINSVSLGSDAAGSVVVDIWKDTQANYPPTVADTITASAKPTLSSAQKSEDTTLTGWTTSIAAGDWLFFNVDSVATIKFLAICLKVTKS